MSQLHKNSRLAMWLLVIANILLPISLLTFAVGFFPYKPFIAGTNQFSSADLVDRPNAPFNKVVFMVVDALRSDFVYAPNSGFSFVQSLIRAGHAVPFTAHATSPTITMPRVKALTTGSIPSFLDVILNFAESDTTSTLANQDTWPLQLSLVEGGKINMFGDDTWIKLFPTLFSRTDGTTSFFVSDFTEVDNNVTRNVPGELRREDWNGLILHYLGLDHIGHKSGPNSPNMIPKQREMDEIVQKVYQGLSGSPHLSDTLLVLCGDHGMNEAGNHGGSAPGETSPALLFISPNLKQISNGLPSPANPPESEFQYYTTVEQSDVVPTLAGLLGFPMPLNNLGVFIPQALDFWPSVQDKKWLLSKNAQQMMGIVRSAYGNIAFDDMPESSICSDPDDDVSRLHCGWQKANTILTGASIDNNDIQLVYKFLRDTQDIMSSVSSNYNMSLLIRGVITGLTAYVFAVISYILSISSGWQIPCSTGTALWVIIIQIAYGAMMFASSYVEEEQHFWYWMSSGWLAWLWLTRYRSRQVFAPICAGLALLITRVVRRWNQTGQKFAGDPDIAKGFFQTHNQLLFFLTISVYSYFFCKVCWWKQNSFGVQATAVIANLYTLLVGVAFKVAFTAEDSPELFHGIFPPGKVAATFETYALSSLARYTFLGIAVLSLLPTISARLNSTKMNFSNGAAYLHDVLSLLLLAQTRPSNMPLLLLFSFQWILLKGLSLTIPELTITIYLLQNASYFAYGGSNAISSIDLSNAYNGVTGYNAAAVGLLTFLSNWAGPVWWSVGGIVLLIQRSPKNVWKPYYNHSAILTMMVATSVVSVQVACLILRTHLFIWTVFSPKYLYAMAWTLGQHLGINIVLSAGMLYYVLG